MRLHVIFIVFFPFIKEWQKEHFILCKKIILLLFSYLGFFVGLRGERVYDRVNVVYTFRESSSEYSFYTYIVLELKHFWTIFFWRIYREVRDTLQKRKTKKWIKIREECFWQYRIIFLRSLYFFFVEKWETHWHFLLIILI